MSEDSKMREEVMWISGGRVLQAVKTACAKVLRYDYNWHVREILEGRWGSSGESRREE